MQCGGFLAHRQDGRGTAMSAAVWADRAERSHCPGHPHTRPFLFMSGPPPGPDNFFSPVSLPKVSSSVILAALALSLGSFVLSLSFAVLCPHGLPSTYMVSGVRYVWAPGRGPGRPNDAPEVVGRTPPPEGGNGRADTAQWLRGCWLGRGGWV